MVADVAPADIVEPEYAPMLFVVSDNDMENRYEQTMLMLSTLRHFKYDQSKIALKVMSGTHCHYVDRYENGLGSLVYEFIMAQK